MDELPDEILVSIIRLLPFKEAVRTSVLAHRWSELWRFVSRIDLETGVIIKQCEECHTEVETFKTPPSTHLVSHLISSLDKIVSSLQSAITCCRISFPDFIHHHNELTDWVKALVHRTRIQELTLVWKPKEKYKKLALPPGMFSGGTLRILSLTNFKLLAASDLDGCTNITTLELESVFLTDTVVDEIIEWESLENLSISSYFCKMTELKIRGQKLKYLRLHGFQALKIDIRVPNLNVLMLEDIFCNYKFIKIDTPNLTLFHADNVHSLTDLNIGQLIHGWKLLENLRLANCSRIRTLKIYDHNLKILELDGLKSFVFEVQAEKLSALALKDLKCELSAEKNLIVLDTPNLEAFHARNVTNFSKENFHQIIRVSKFLKDVVLHCCPQVTEVNIDHRNLQILQLKELTLNELKMRVEKLHVLEIGNVSCPIKDMVIKAPNLINLQLYNTSEKNKINRLLPVDLLENQSLRLEILHTLSISLDLNIIRDINILSSVLKLCTRLEALKIMIQESNATLSSWGVNGDCMFWNDERTSTAKGGIDYNCLRTVELHGYRDNALEFEFYKHLMQKATNLEKISIQFYDESSGKDIIQYGCTEQFCVHRPSPTVSINFISFDGNRTVEAPRLSSKLSIIG